MKAFQSVTALIIILCVLAVVLPSSAGTYKDRDGASHMWTIDDGHTLIWDNAPYMPFGVVFEPRYLAVGQTDENWKADEQDIAAFKLVGVTDIIIRPSKGLTTVPAAAVQRVIDMLETNGLQYGFELHDPDYAPLVGYVVQPTVNRTDGIMTSGDVTHNLPDTDTAIYALCDGKTGEVKDYGRKSVTDGQISTPVIIRNGGAHVMLYYPHKAASGAGIFDVWKGFDQHRDSLIVYLKQIKFGKGLRFFIDPFGQSFGIGDDADSIIPTSTAFRFEYAAWLTKRYTSPGNLNVAWGILKHDINSFDEATRLIPLWRDGRGASMVFDDGLGKTYPADAGKSAIWDDLRQFRSYSIRGYMDTMADVAKRIAGDVPVIYTANGLQSIFQASGPVGFDGLVMPGADGVKAVAASAGQTLSLAENSSRKMWLLSHLKPVGAAYDKKQDLFAAMNTAHDLGAKGFFVDDARGTGVDGANLISWLAEYASLSLKDKQFGAYKARAIFYPERTAGASVKKLSNGAWWLPSLTPGTDLYLGTKLAGYAVINPQTFDITICVWSTKGSQLIHLVAESKLAIMNASGSTTELKPKKGRVEFTVGDDPVFVHGIAPDDFIPVEVVMEAIQEMDNAIARGDRKHMDTSNYKSKLKNAQTMMKANQLSLCLNLVHQTTAEINQRLRGLDVMPSLGSDTPSRR